MKESVFRKLNRRHTLIDGAYIDRKATLELKNYIDYIAIDSDISKTLMEIIPKEYRDKFIPMFMRISNPVPKHVDMGIATTINFYVRTGDAVTTFYKNGEKIDSFQASPGDIWVLNVRTQHDVQGTIDNYRCAFVLQSFLPFKRVVQILEEANENI